MRLRYLSIAPALMLCAALAMAQAPDQAQAGDQSQSQPGIAQQSAPQTQRRAPNPQRAARHLGKQLGLTKDQVAQVEPIIANRQQQMQSARSDTTLTPKDRRVKVRGIMQDSNNQIEALLNDSQKQQYEQMLQSRRAQRHQQPQQAQ